MQSHITSQVDIVGGRSTLPSLIVGEGSNKKGMLEIWGKF